MSIRSQKLPIGSQTKDIFVKISIIKLSDVKERGEKHETAFLENCGDARFSHGSHQQADNFTMGLVSAGRRLIREFSTTGERTRN